MASKCLINLLIGCLMLIVKGESQSKFEFNSNIKYDQLQKRRTISHNIFRTGTVYPKQNKPLKALLPGCNKFKCSEHCEDIGAGNGHCQNNLCWCDSNPSSPKIKQLPELTTPLFNIPQNVPTDKCGKYDCDVYCEQSEAVDGYCVGNSCQCNYKLVQPNKLPFNNKKEDIKRNSNLAGCVESECSTFCINNGSSKGMCVCDKEEYTLCRDNDWFCKCS